MRRYDASYSCLCLPVCLQSLMSSPLHHLSYRRLTLLIRLHAPVSLSWCFWTSFCAAPLPLLYSRFKSSISSAGHPSSVLSQAFHQSNFAIVAICSHTLAGWVIWSGLLFTQICCCGQHVYNCIPRCFCRGTPSRACHPRHTLSRHLTHSQSVKKWGYWK